MKPLALAIENDGGTRKLLDVLLTRAGFEVDLVPTGSDALLLLANVRYDVRFIDLLLPGTNGVQILEHPPLVPVFEQNESRALAAVPLRRGGRVIGAVGWSFRQPRLVTKAGQQPFLSIAATVAEGLPDQHGQSLALAGA